MRAWRIVTWAMSLTLFFAALSASFGGGSAIGDGYYPNATTDKVTGLSGVLKPDLSGRLGGSMPVTPDLQRLPVAHTCGICRGECQQKWRYVCQGNGCSRAYVACIEACWWNDCRGSR